MKLAYALACVALVSACDANRSSTPEPGVISTAPAPAPESGSPGGEQTLDDGLPSTPSDLGPSTAELKFVAAARAYIVTLKLPESATFAMKSDDEKKAKLFVGLRCSSMVRKMKAAAKSFSNLYDDTLLGSVCSAKDVRLIPGQSVSSFARTGILSVLDRKSIEISVRPDYTVSGYRIFDTHDPFFGGLSSSETIATIEGDRRIKSYRSGEIRSLDVTDSAGRISYSENESYVKQTRDGSLRKMLTVRGMREGRTLTVAETTLIPAPGFLGRRREKSVGCSVQMLNSDGTVYAEAHESAACFPPRLSL
jgi:hypothetical protein